MIENIQKAQKQEYDDFSLIHLICSTLELRPLLKVKANEYEDIESEVLQYKLLHKDEFSDDFLDSVKTSLMFTSWLNEETEDIILKKYKVPPGELKYKIDIANWLLYSLQELSRLLEYTETARDVKTLRVRMKHGIKQELLPLIKLKGIGRVRARKLFNNKIRTLQHLKIINYEVLSKLIGRKTAASIKEQLGVPIGSLKDY